MRPDAGQNHYETLPLSMPATTFPFLVSQRLSICSTFLCVPYQPQLLVYFLACHIPLTGDLLLFTGSSAESVSLILPVELCSDLLSQSSYCTAE